VKKKYILSIIIITIFFQIYGGKFECQAQQSNPSYASFLADSVVDTRTSSESDNKYQEFQDSLYKRFLNLNVTSKTLFQFNLSLSDDEWSKVINNTSELPYQAALRSLNAVPSISFIPTGEEKVRYASNLEAARHVPFVQYPNYGVKVALNDIGVFLGLIEDTSPEIFYTLDSPNDVEIVVYSIQAKVIATLFNGKQIPGKYKLTWNYRDDNGRKMISGDYIAEVRIGNVKFIRKRIVIP
jgi:hypothetical protein